MRAASKRRATSGQLNTFERAIEEVGLAVLALLTPDEPLAVARRILDHLGLDSTGPPLARVQAQPELLDPGPDYSAPDPIYPE